MVAEFGGSPSGPSSSSSSDPQPISVGSAAPTAPMGHSRLETVRTTLEARGLPEAAFKLLLSRYKIKSDQQSGSLYYYQRLWNAWLAWCQPSIEKAYKFDEDAVAGFISHLWQEGSTISKVRTSLSVLEVTKRVIFPERPPFLQNGLIRSLVEAARVDRPMRKKGPSGAKGELVPYFDVATITLFWRNQKPNDKLSLYSLRKKVATLLTIDLFLRGADLFSFTEEGISFERNPHGYPLAVHFKVTDLKEHRSQEIRWTNFRVECICQEFKDSCTCCAVDAYLRKSAKRRKKVEPVALVNSGGSEIQVRKLLITHKNKARALSIDRLRHDLQRQWRKVVLEDGLLTL